MWPRETRPGENIYRLKGTLPEMQEHFTPLNYAEIVQYWKQFKKSTFDLWLSELSGLNYLFNIKVILWFLNYSALIMLVFYRIFREEDGRFKTYKSWVSRETDLETRLKGWQDT